MKIIFVALFLIVAVSADPEPKALCNTENRHDLTDGDCGQGNLRLVYKKDLNVGAKLLQVNTRQISWPEVGSEESQIECIKVTDKVANSYGGCPSILEGGARLKHVVLEFISQRSREMKFHVEIYTK